MEENLTAQAGRAEPPDARNSSIDFAKEPDQGRLYRAYKMLEKDPQKAILELKALVKVHSIMSMIYLGDAYKFGTGVEANLNEAEEWYRLAANAGSLPAHYLLGRLYLNMERYAEAKTAFAYAADQDYMPATHFMGRIYFYGRGVQRDIDLAQSYLTRASDQGSVFAKRKLATLLMQRRRGVKERMIGLWLLVTSFVDLFLVVCFEGTQSTRLR